MSTSNQATVQASPATSTTSATILAGSGTTARKAVLVWNDSAAILYLAFTASAATATNATVPVAAGQVYEFPQPLYAGPVTGILASGAGFARVTTW